MHAAHSPVDHYRLRGGRMSSRQIIPEDRNSGSFRSHGLRGGRVSITTCCYHKSVVYYSRTMADSSRTDMLFSSGDSPRTLSSILSGEGFDEREQGQSPLSIRYLYPHLRASRARTSYTISSQESIVRPSRSSWSFLP